MVLSSERCFFSLFQKISVRIYPFLKVSCEIWYTTAVYSPFQQFATNSSRISKQRARCHSAVVQLICKDPEKMVGEGEIIWNPKAGGDNLQSYFLTFKNRASYVWDGRTATLQMLHFIYFFSTNISTEYFKHAAHSPFFSSKCNFFL
jgi:hypothetical protein